MTKKRIVFSLALTAIMVLGLSLTAYTAVPSDAEIAKQFDVFAPHAAEFSNEGAFTVKNFAPNTIMTNGVIDPFFAGGGTMHAPTDSDAKKMKIYVIAIDFNDCPGDVFIPYGVQRNVFTDPANASVFDLSYPEVYYNNVFFGSAGLKTLDSSKFVWRGTTAAHEIKGLKQLVEEMSMGRFEVEVECLNERLAEVQGLNPDSDKWPWFHIDGPLLEYATQGPADCEDYRQFAKTHQAGINAAYRDIPGLDIEDIDFIYTIVPQSTHGYRSGLQGGSGLDTSFSYNDQALIQRDGEYRHEPGIVTKGGRSVGSGVFGVKGVWGYTGSGFPASQPNAMSAVRVSLHEFTHGMGMIDDYSYGGMGTNPGEATASGAGGWGVMASAMGSATPDLFAWRKFRMGWLNDDEVQMVLPGETVTINIRALGSYQGDGGTYTDDPSIKTRLVMIPKEWRTRDTFGMVWNNGWNPNRTNYNWYDWFSNPWVGGETHAIKSFPTFYTLESRKPLGADSTMPATGGTAGGSAGVVVSYVANPTWETGCGAGGFKVMTGNNGLRVGATTSWSDAHIGLTVTVLESNVFYDRVTIAYTGTPTNAAQHVYQGLLTVSDNYITAGQEFTADFGIFTIGTPAPNDASALSATIMRVATPLGVPGGLSGFTMEVGFDADNLDYVSAGAAPFTYTVDTTDAATGKLVVVGLGDSMVDKDTILSLNFKPKATAALKDYTISGKITDVTLLNWRGETVVKGGSGFKDVGTFGNGTFAAIYNTTANNTYTPGINSSGGKVTVGANATYTLQGALVCDTPGPAPGTWIGVEGVVDLYNSSDVKIASVKSDWDGNYTIKGVPAGSGYYIKGSKPKYDEGISAVFTVAGHATLAELKLDHTLYTVSGTIYGSVNSDGSGAVPLGGAKVYIVNTGNAYEILGGPATTNADGTYTVQARAEHQQYAAVAVSADGYSSHVILRNGVGTNLGTLFGRNPADAYFGTTTQMGANNIYNFRLNANVSGRDVILTSTQDVQIRVTPYSTATVYQLRDVDGNAVGSPVNSWGGMNTTRGDDVLRNVAPGLYYIEVSRSGYISSCTAPFGVSSTRAILRNNVGTHALTMVATGSGQTLAGRVINAITGEPLEGVKIVNIPYSATYGSGVPIATAANGTFSYLTVNSARDLVFSKEGFITRSVYRAAGAASGLVIELMPAPVGGELAVALADLQPARPGNVAMASFGITNTGEATDYIRVSVAGVDAVLPNDLFVVEAGETITVPFYVTITADVLAQAQAYEEIIFTAASLTNDSKAGYAALAVEDLIIYNYRLTLHSGYAAGDMVEVDVILSGDINYTQLNAAIAFDSELLEFAGYANLGGLAAEVKNAGDTINIRSVPSLNMLQGATCAPAVRVVTLIFTVNDVFEDGGINSEFTIAAQAVTPAAGVKGAVTAPVKPLSIVLE